MKNRREFLWKAFAIPFTLAFAHFLAACAKKTSEAPDDGDDGVCSNGLTSTSTTASGHTHRITVTQADITAGVDKTYTTSNDGGHTHTVTLTAADLAALGANTDVNVTSSYDSLHDHDFLINC